MSTPVAVALVVVSCVLLILMIRAAVNKSSSKKGQDKLEQRFMREEKAGEANPRPKTIPTAPLSWLSEPNKNAVQKPASVVPAYPAQISGTPLAYKYDDVRIYVPDDVALDPSALTPGTQVDLIAEPENTYDPHAVAVSVGGTKIGYLLKGRIQDMANDFHAQSLPVFAQVYSASVESKDVMLRICFYRGKPKSTASTKREFRLTGNRGREMQENIEASSVGDEVTFFFDPDKAKYMASTVDDIGYLPASAEKFFEGGNPRGVVSRIEIDSNGKYIIYVTLETE